MGPNCKYLWIIEFANMGCATKDCIDRTRGTFIIGYYSSLLWECVDPSGNAKLCGNYESNRDNLFILAGYADLSRSHSTPPSSATKCKALFNAWEKRPEGMSFDLF